jgi:cytochrome c553
MFFRLSLPFAVLICVTFPTLAKPTNSLAWAYPIAPDAAENNEPADNNIYTVPGSKLHLTRSQIEDYFNPVDWRPQDHPPMPAVVAHGTPPGNLPCAACHMPNGQGVHGVVNLAGLSAEYITAQVKEFADGNRVSFISDRPAVALMIAAARRIDADNLRAAANYYAGLRFGPWIRVIESNDVPRTRPNHYGWLDVVDGHELIAGRIIEVPEDPARSDIYDPDSGFIAYVPVGAPANGRRLAEGNDRRIPGCASCHGDGLHGAIAPPLAGRSPSYLARQLWDIKKGARHGPAVLPMRAVVAKMTPADIVSLVAYLASLPP